MNKDKKFLNYKMKYSYSDISIVPTVLSNISSRSECNPYVKNGLPIFTAPMDSVVGEKNYNIWENYGITSIIPRTIPLQLRIDLAKKNYWIAVGLDEFKNLISGSYNIDGWSILIDVANGHMKILYDLVKESKKKYTYTVMVGNIANPGTYHIAADAGVDYIRVGIGGGYGCITSSNTAIHYPMASLIYETYLEKKALGHGPYIVADGGIRGYGDVIKALALGADYVMCGSVLSRCLEASGDLFVEGENCYPHRIDRKNIKYKGGGEFYAEGESTKIFKNFYGMASSKGQIAIGGKHTKTSEGICRKIKIEYTIESWSKNMTDYLKSAMSYLGCKDLKDIKNSKIAIISNGTYNSINK